MHGPSPSWELLPAWAWGACPLWLCRTRTPAPLSALLHATNQAWEGFGYSFVWELLCMLLFLSLSVAGGAFSFL